MSNLPKINSVWRGTDHVRFTVNSIIESEHGPVVHYTRNTDNLTFYCLVGAFLQRFTSDVA
jgi:hypothetical protein